MYRKKDRNQVNLDEFILPFGGKLSAENRWVELAKIMPWDMIEDIYAKTFKDEKPDGRPPIPARIAFGALFIRDTESFVDKRTTEHIGENPYMQYFLGLHEFKAQPLFDPSMMTHFRKRFSKEDIAKINEELYRRQHPEKEEPPEDGGNRGTLVLDATVAPADVRYPTDLSLLNECRENTERMIEEIWEKTERKGHKTAYSRKKARSKYLKVAKQRKPRKNVVRAAVKEQLDYVEKNLETLEKLVGEAGENALSPKRLIRLKTIRLAAAQQREMLKKGVPSCADRIVSLRQPHVRPIVRGKAGAATEFGQKLEFAVIDGFTFIEEQSFDNFNEGITLIASAEKFKARFGVYPEAILADTIFRNRDNRVFCKKNGIRLSGPKLGRPKKDEAEQDKEQAYRDSCGRNIVESRNGIAKRRYSLNLILPYLDCTALTEAAMIVFAMNAAHCLRVILCQFSARLFKRVFYRQQPVF